MAPAIMIEPQACRTALSHRA